MIAVVVLLLLFGIYSLVNLFLRYWFLSIAVMLAGLIYLAHTVGTALMFPGAFSYFRGSIEMAYSTDMSKSTHINLTIIEKACESVLAIKPDESNRFYPSAMRNVEWVVKMFGKYQAEGTLSERKVRLLAHYQ